MTITPEQKTYYSAVSYGYSLLAAGERELARAERLEPYGLDNSSSIAHHEEMAAGNLRWAAYWAHRANGMDRDEAAKLSGVEIEDIGSAASPGLAASGDLSAG